MWHVRAGKLLSSHWGVSFRCLSAACFHAYILTFQADSQPTLQGRKIFLGFFAAFVFLQFPPLPLKKHRLYDTKAQTGRLSEIPYFYHLYNSCFSTPQDFTARGAVESTRRKDGPCHQRMPEGCGRMAGEYVEATRPCLSVPQAISSLATDRLYVNQMANEFLVSGPAVVSQWRTWFHLLNLNNPVECPCWTLAGVGLPRQNALRGMHNF